MSDAVELIAKIARGELDLVRALELQPVVLERLVDRAQGMITHGKREEGIALLVELVKVVNRSAALPFLLAGVLDESKEHARAASAYDLAIMRATANGDASIAQKAKFCRGRNAAALGDLPGALEDIRAAESGPDREISKVAALWNERLSRIEVAS